MSGAQPIDSADRPGFLASALSAEGRFSDVSAARRWLERAAPGAAVPRRTDPVRGDLRGWRFEPDSGDLTHESGHFFRVQGVRARCDFPAPLRFEQPIVNQPEIGVLGILAKRFDGVLHFLLQAKMEPGNIDLDPVVADGPGDAQQLHARARRQAPTVSRLLPAARRQSRAGGSASVRAGALLPAQAQPEHHRGDRRRRSRSMTTSTG